MKAQQRICFLACLAIATIFVATPAVRAQQGVPSTDSIRGALSRLKSDLQGTPGGLESTRSKRWIAYLQVEEMEQALGENSFSTEHAEDAMRRLQRVQAMPSHLQLERTISAVHQYLGGGAGEDAIKAVADLEHHITTLGPRGAGWKQILALDQLRSQLGGETEGEGQQAEEDNQGILSSMGVLQQESQGILSNSDGARTPLQHALLDWQARTEYVVTDPLAVAVRDAKDQFHPVRPDQLDTARSALLRAMQRLESFLAGGSQENSDRWQAFLKWDLLQEQANSGSPRLRELAKSYQRLRSGEAGLSVAPFRDVRHALRIYLERLQLFDGHPGRVVEGRRELQSAIEGLQRYLATASPQREDNWKRFLRWEELEELLDQDVRDIRRYARVLSRFEADEAGLELAPFRRVANRLGKQMELIAASNRGVTDTDRVAAQLEKLARDLQAYATEPGAVTVAAIQEHVQWLQATGQLPNLASRIRARFEQPNIQFKIQSDVVARALSDGASTTDPVAMWFYGSWVTGTTESSVSYRGQLVPSSNAAVIDILVGGAAKTVSVGAQRRVRVFSNTDTSLSATKRLIFDGFQITSLPAVATAKANQRVCGVNVNRRCGRRLIGRFARRRAAQLRPCAEDLANCKGRKQLSEGLDTQTDKTLVKTNQRLAELRGRLQAQELFPDQLDVHSTAQTICMQATLRSGGVFAAATPAPQMSSDSDVVAQLHESVVNNLLAARIAGLKIDNEGIETRLKEFNIEMPEPPESAQNTDLPDIGEDGEEDIDEPWSMQFDQVAPVSVSFRNGTATITVRGTNFTRGDQKINNAIDLKATYEFAFSQQSGLSVRRVGDVEISFVGVKGQLSTRQITYKTFLARKVKRLFRERISMSDFPAGELKDLLGQLPTKAVYARSGWLTIGVDIDDSMLKDAMGS